MVSIKILIVVYFVLVSDLETPNLDFILDQQLSLHSQYRNAMLKFKENLIINSL